MEKSTGRLQTVYWNITIKLCIIMFADKCKKVLKLGNTVKASTIQRTY